MAGSKNTLSDLLSRLVIDVDNMNAFLYSLQNILESQSENVSISQTLNDGTKTIINVPSFGYMKGKIDALNSQFDTLISANDNVIGIKSSNGDVRKFELKKVSKLIQELEEIKSTSFTLPTTFGIKNNWFFESFLNPLLFVAVDVSTILTDDIDKFSIKRVIVNSINDDILQYFDDTYKNVNNIILDDLISDLQERAIDFFEDDNVIEMEPAVNRFKGSFDVTRILDETVPQTITSTGEVVSVARRRYTLNILTYTDILDGTNNTKFLSEGDVVITDNDSEYKVLSVDRTNSEVVLERIFGIEPITIGASVLRIKPVPYRVPALQINVGYNEREVVFVRPISKANNITIDDYSNGFGIFTNDLTITLEDDSTSTLESYYNNFVADFGLILLNAAKERKLPAILAETPTSPTLTVEDFKVVQIDQHIKEDEDATTVSNQIAQKENLKSQIKENLKEIDSLKSKLNDTQKNQSEKNRIEKKIKTSTDKRATLQTQLTTTVKGITNLISTTPAFIQSAKYRVRGFWTIPDAKQNRYGKQEVVQFKVRYRYLSKKGTAPNAEQSKVTQADASVKLASFSPWTEELTKPRTKELDNTTGLYIWKTEDISSSEEININQLDIAIRKGETVEIQVKSVSEAGWPDNPVESEWSTAIQIPFPDDIESAEEATILSQKTFAEEARLDFEDELNSRGLDLHLQNQFTTGERFFAHKANDITSGFFTTEGSVIDLFEQLQSYKTQIDALREAITQDRGKIKVSVIDPLGNVSEVKNGDTIDLFAGYYRDDIIDTSGPSIVYNEGRPVTKRYIISVSNTSANPLELVALLQGGIEEVAPTSNPVANPDSDYHVNRRYDLIPLSIGSAIAGDIADPFNQPGYQSSQVQGQYIYNRYKNYGLSESMYSFYPGSNTAYVPVGSPGYNAGGIVVGSDRVPLTWGHYLPFKPEDAVPLYPNGGTSANIWNGTTNGAGLPIGNGYISEFCIHKDHPSIANLGVSFDVSVGPNLNNLILPVFKQNTAPPVIDSDATQVALLFAQAVHSESSKDENTSVLGLNYLIQASRETSDLVASNNNTLRRANNYPIKLGYNPDDEYLIGKYTCGSYLYVFPDSYSNISVEGNHPSLSSKKVEFGTEQSINIPVLFQYRCSDKLGNIGGYRLGTSLNNITYAKKIGIDIFLKNEGPFSFDLVVSTKYKKETTLAAPIVPSRGVVNVTF
jgi:hypothetical protein